MNCKNCGAPIRPDAPRCMKCGSQLEWAAPQPAAQIPYASPVPPYMPPPVYPVAPAAVDAPRSKLVAALLAFFLGFLGIHNFYLGHIGRAVAQLLISAIVGPFTCGAALIVTGLWAFIEFILILTGTIRDKYGRPLT